MPTEILRIENISIGQLDDTNYYVAEVAVGGKGSKDEGQERLEKMKYYPVLHSCIWKAADRVVRAENTKNLKAWAEALERMTLAAIKRCEEAGRKLEGARKESALLKSHHGAVTAKLAKKK